MTKYKKNEFKMWLGTWNFGILIGEIREIALVEKRKYISDFTYVMLLNIIQMLLIIIIN